MCSLVWALPRKSRESRRLSPWWGGSQHLGGDPAKLTSDLAPRACGQWARPVQLAYGANRPGNPNIWKLQITKAKKSSYGDMLWPTSPRGTCAQRAQSSLLSMHVPNTYVAEIRPGDTVLDRRSRWGRIDIDQSSYQPGKTRGEWSDIMAGS